MAPASSIPSVGLVVANVAGRSIDITELLGQWVHQKPNDAFDAIDHLVLTRLVAAEAERLGVSITAEAAQKGYENAVAEMEKEIQKRRPGVTLDQWVDQMLGLEPYSYRERLRADAVGQLVAERVTRAFLLQSEYALVRVIAVKSESELKQVQEALAKGDDFGDVARKFSIDPSSKDGGRYTPVVRAETAMGKLVFETAVGSTSDPRYNQGTWLVVKVDARPKPIDGLWPQIREAVEKSLVERGIEDLEFTQWRAAMMRRYQVDIDPFLKLAGQPVR